MSPPPIRYPLPSLLAAIVVALLAWSGQGVIRQAASALAMPVRRVVNGPDYPSSKAPKIGPLGIAPKVLLLKDDLPLRTTPSSKPAETFGRRGFADLFDVWPSGSKPSDLRVGNGRLVGWVEAKDALAWETRLVLKLPEGAIPLSETPGGSATMRAAIEGAPIPVLAWEDGGFEVATWKPAKPWAEVGSSGWIKPEDIRPESWGVLLTNAETAAIRRASRRSTTSADRDRLRIRAILGSVLDDRRVEEAATDSARSHLPAVAFANRSEDPIRSIGAPSEVAASWGGVTFRFVPLIDLP